ncbi:MAG: adenylyltransferase/cytidyltransferase family protein [Verrucomicrobia bacterium]|nr:adenylyltransferase/cytidyltransferase family protein [Verrucomicrobiota bacterium]
MRDKIQSLANLTAIRRRLRRAGRRVVLTNGCFDLLHPGHVEYLEKAKRFGDALVVALNSDRSVRALKGAGRPIMPQCARAELLAGLAAVDYVVIFNGARATAVMRALEPDVYVKGGDYTLATLDADERCVLEACGTTIKLVKLKKGYSTSSIVERIKRTA